MKIRIRRNSVRYRLDQKDVREIAKTGVLEDYVKFADQTFIYAIQVSDCDDLSSSFKNNTITMMLSASMLKELVETDRVGFENSENGLHLLLEKDFTCLDNVAEDQSNNYPNPLAQKRNG